MSEELLTNHAIPGEFRKKAEELIAADEKLMFALIGDLDLKGKYGTSAIMVTNRRVFAFDKYHDNGVLVLDISGIKESKVKRMYG
ncbi:MAG: hypothetical protein GX851_07110, partial [Clostridiales bacterium]|nr:hypothetical protein [Clostridiales bacterium]